MKRTLQQFKQSKQCIYTDEKMMMAIQEEKDRQDDFQRRWTLAQKAKDEPIIINNLNQVNAATFENVVLKLNTRNAVEDDWSESEREKLWSAVSDIIHEQYAFVDHEHTYSLFKDCIPMGCDEVQGLKWIKKEHYKNKHVTHTIKDIFHNVVENALTVLDFDEQYPNMKDIAIQLVNPTIAAKAKDTYNNISYYPSLMLFSMDMAYLSDCDVGVIIIRDPLFWKIKDTYPHLFSKNSEGYLLTSTKAECSTEIVDITTLEEELIKLGKLFFACGTLLKNGNTVELPTLPGTTLSIGAHTEVDSVQGIRIKVDERKTHISLGFWKGILHFSMSAVYTPEATSQYSAVPITCNSPLFAIPPIPEITGGNSNLIVVPEQSLIHIQAWLRAIPTKSNDSCELLPLIVNGRNEKAKINRTLKFKMYDHVVLGNDYSMIAGQFVESIKLHNAFVNVHGKIQGRLTLYEVDTGQLMMRIDWSTPESKCQLMSSFFYLPSNAIESEVLFGFNVLKLTTNRGITAVIQLLDDANLLLSEDGKNNFICASLQLEVKDVFKELGVHMCNVHVHHLQKIKYLPIFKRFKPYLNNQSTEQNVSNMIALLSKMSLKWFFLAFRPRLNIYTQKQILELVEKISPKRDNVTVMENAKMYELSFKTIDVDRREMEEGEKQQYFKIGIESEYIRSGRHLEKLSAEQNESTTTHHTLGCAEIYVVPKHLLYQQNIPWCISSTITDSDINRSTYSSKIAASFVQAIWRCKYNVSQVNP